jgi:N-dimethylarginine dimethylaminohydrolase
LRRSLRVLLLLFAATVLARGERARPAAPKPERSEAAIATWIWHVEPYILSRSLPTFRDLLEKLPGDARVLVAMGAGVDSTFVWESLGLGHRAESRIRLLDEIDALSPWARDRYVVFDRGKRTCVLLPSADSVASGAVGDLVVARKLGAFLGGLEVVESKLDVEGGDVIVTDEHVFVGIGTILANGERFPDGVEAHLEELFEREVVVVGEEGRTVPHPHVDMFLTAIGSRRLLLGDPRLAEGYFRIEHEPDAATSAARAIGSMSRQTQEERVPDYEAIAGQLRGAGFVVERIPILHTDDDDLVTWNNVVTERRGSKRHAYVPAYGIPVLDRLAHERWRQLGYDVHPVRATEVILHGGAIRCLSNVVRRTSD